MRMAGVSHTNERRIMLYNLVVYADSSTTESTYSLNWSKNELEVHLHALSYSGSAYLY